MWACLACVGILASSIAATLVAQVVDGDIRYTSRNQFYILLTIIIPSIATLIVAIANLWYTWKSEGRKRKWQEDDLKRQEEREAREKAAREHAEQDRTRMETKIDVGIQKVDDNTTITKAGIHEAVATAKAVKDTAEIEMAGTKQEMSGLRAAMESLKAEAISKIKP